MQHIRNCITKRKFKATSILQISYNLAVSKQNINLFLISISTSFVEQYPDFGVSIKSPISFLNLCWVSFLRS